MTTTEFKDTASGQNEESQYTTSTRKRGSKNDASLQQQDRETFFKNLFTFNERRNTPIVRLPKISGEEIDLHKLYAEVISRGGWLKVNIRNDWEDVLIELGISTKCVNGVVALKQIYSRFLDKFEKVYFLGEDPDRPDEPEDDDRQSRHKKWSEKTTHVVPMSYNYSQHNVSDQVRFTSKMSTDLYKNSEYEKLLLSLVSPLPNEQDFAINVCTLMANESKHILKIENCPKLLDALVAHAGVFCHVTMRQLFDEFYSKTRKHSLQSFWEDLLFKIPQILELSHEDSYQFIQENDEDDINMKTNKAEEIFEDGLNANEYDDNEIKSLDFDRLDFLSLGRDLGTREYVGQRVQQISSIFRNLSFFEENIPVMAKNRTFVRFLVMCSNIRWGNLHHVALDICGNLASELELLDPTTDNLTRCLLSTVCEGIESHDRGVIISCLEILNKLCQKDTNEDYLIKCLNQKLYNQMCLYLSLNDIMLLLYTLECIYGLTSLGQTSCNAFIQVKGIVDSLVSLVTVEAQSYGPDGCILMRVVETVPGNMLPMVAQNIANLQNVALGQLKQPPQPQPQIVQPENPTKASNQISASNVTAPSLTQQASVNQNSTPQKQNPSSQSSVQQEHEQFAVSWLTATLESAPPISNRIEQLELYKLYTAAVIKNGKRGCVSQAHFPRIVRSIFGTNIGPTMLKITDSNGAETNMFFYVNLKFRAQPLPLKIMQQPSQPIINQQQSGHQHNTNISQNTQSSNQNNENIQNKTQCNGSNYSSTNGVTTNNLNSSSQTQLNTFETKNPSQNFGTQQNNGPIIPHPSTQVSGVSYQQTDTNTTSKPLPYANNSVQQQTAKPSVPIKLQTHNQNMQQKQQYSPQSPIQPSVTGNCQKIQQQQIVKQQQTQQFKQQTENIQQSHQQPQQKVFGNVIITQHSGQIATKTTTIGQTQMTTTTHIPSNAGGSTAIIKSLLANKLAQRQNAKQKEITNHSQPKQQNNLHGTSIQINNTSQKLSTTTISALVNNPIIQTTPVKVGQTTIKPINPHLIEKKNTFSAPIENMDINWEPVPPLAPANLNNSTSTIRSIVVQSSSVSSVVSEDSCNSIASSAVSTNQVLINDETESSLINFDGLLIPKTKSSISTSSSIIDDESSKDSTIKGSQFINANKMLVNLLDKKSPDPPALTIGIKRKIIDDNISRKKPFLITQIEEPEVQVTPSKNAANLYAEMAASILEDEDLEDVSVLTENSNKNSSVPQIISNITIQKPQITQQPLQQQQAIHTVMQKPQEQKKQILTMPLHRQIIVSPNVSHQQVILSQNPITVQAQHQQQTITTSNTQGNSLKNDSIQSVPVILQKQITTAGQQIIQPVIQQQPQTQYVLATNAQGQTYLVAQQTHSQPQPTVLLQTQGQQNPQTKTIIILQQQPGSAQAVATPQQIISNATNQPQKMIMTTSQGQQMIVTQVPRPPVQQIIVNQAGNVLPQNVVLTQTVLPQPAQASPTIQQIQQSSQQSQLSPQLQIQQTVIGQQNQSHSSTIIPHITSNGSTIHIQQQPSQQQQNPILSTLPQIPATIKLHTPPTTINAKSISQQGNVTTKVIAKPGTPTISIVGPQNSASIQSNTVQPQIIQQIVKSAVAKVPNSPLAKVTLQQQQQQAGNNSSKGAIITSQSQQIIASKTQTNTQQTQIIKASNQIQRNPVIQTQPQSQVISQQKLQQSVQNQTITSAAQTNSIIATDTGIQIQKGQSIHSSIHSAASQHTNIVQQILAQNPSQTQIIQKSPIIQTTTPVVMTAQNKTVLINHIQQKLSPSLPSPQPTISNSLNITNIPNNTKPQANLQLPSSPAQQANSTPSNEQNHQNITQTSSNQSDVPINSTQNNVTESPNTNSTLANNSTSTNGNPDQSNPPPPPPPPQNPKPKLDDDIAEISYLFVCDWRNCPRKKYKSIQEVYKHACQVHCPEGLDPAAEIYCQWGPGPGFCDNIPRKRFSLMTHLQDRHCTIESMKAAVQRRLVMGIPQPTHANPVTIIKSMEARGSTASPALSTSSSSSAPSSAIMSAAMHAIKRHSGDFLNPKELMDENEGPVTKSIRLTAALILRNLVTYTDKAKRHIRQYEPHLAGVALSNVESSRTISQILYELNN